MKVAPDIFLAKPKLSFNELVLFLQYLLLFASLAYSYMFIFPKFSSSSPYYLHVQFNPAACCVSMLFLFLWAFVVREKVESFSALFLTLFFSTIIIPLLVIYSCGGMPGIFVFYSASALMVLNFFVYSRFSLVCFKPAQQQAVALMLCAAVVLSVLLLFFLKDGYSHVNFSFRINKLYPKRAYADNYIFSGIFSYLISWFGKVCNIFLIIYFLARKRYFIFLFFVFIQIIFASIASEKSFFIYSFFSIFFYYFMRFSKSQNFFVFLLNALVIVSVYLYYSTGSIILQNFLVRRVFMDTANMIFLYYHYFFNHALLYFSANIPGSNLPIPNFIGKTYLADATNSANAGFFATAYASFGFLGMLFSSVFLGAYLKVVDKIIEGKLSLAFACACLIPSFWSLRSSALTTSFFTHGILLATFLLFLFACSKRADGGGYA